MLCPLLVLGQDLGMDTTVNLLQDSITDEIVSLDVLNKQVIGIHNSLPNHNWWNNTFVNLFQNPAMTAFNEQHNFLLQWEAPFYASRLFGTKALFAYEFNLPMLNEKHPRKFNWGTGIYYNNMGYGDRFKRIQFGIAHSFSANLKKGGQLRLGFEFFNFYIHPLTEDQVDGQIAPNQGSGTRIRDGAL